MDYSHLTPEQIAGFEDSRKNLGVRTMEEIRARGGSISTVECEFYNRVGSARSVAMKALEDKNLRDRLTDVELSKGTNEEVSRLDKKISDIEAKHATQIKDLHNKLDKANLELFQQSQVFDQIWSLLSRVEKVVSSIDVGSVSIIADRVKALEDQSLVADKQVPPAVIEALEAQFAATIESSMKEIEDKVLLSLRDIEAGHSVNVPEHEVAVKHASKPAFEDIPLSDALPVVGRPVPSAPPVDDSGEADDTMGWLAKWRLTSSKKDFKAQLSKVCDLEDKMDYEERTHRLAGTTDQVGTDKRRREYDAEKLKLSDLRMTCINVHKKYLSHLTMDEIECKMHA